MPRSLSLYIFTVKIPLTGFYLTTVVVRVARRAVHFVVVRNLRSQLAQEVAVLVDRCRLARPRAHALLDDDDDVTRTT